MKLSSDAAIQSKNCERGYAEEYVGTAFGIDVTNVLWHDTKNVRLLSTYVGTQYFDTQTQCPSSKVSRWDRKIKKNIEVECPTIISEYNKHMGGVDLMDGLIGRYRIRMKSRKWTSRIFFHILDAAMVNSYILFHRLHGGSTTCQLPDFRTEIAESLLLCGSTQGPKRGRPASATPPPKSPTTTTRTCLPQIDVRFDQIGHWCEFSERTGKKQCKLAGCKSETQAFCVKCKVNLCNSTKKKCFTQFHTL